MAQAAEHRRLSAHQLTWILYRWLDQQQVQPSAHPRSQPTETWSLPQWTPPAWWGQERKRVIDVRPACPVVDGKTRRRHIPVTDDEDGPVPEQRREDHSRRQNTSDEADDTVATNSDTPFEADSPNSQASDGPDIAEEVPTDVEEEVGQQVEQQLERLHIKIRVPRPAPKRKADNDSGDEEDVQPAKKKRGAGLLSVPVNTRMLS